MVIALLLGIMGLLLISTEFYLPGGIMAVIGAMMGFAGISLALYTDWRFGLLYGALEIIGLVLLIRFTLKVVKASELSLSDDQEGFTSSSFDASLIGMDGEVIVDLRPSGYVLVRGIRCQAMSEGDYVKKGTRVTVVDGEGAHLIVR